MKDISLITYIKEHIEDDYAMNVLYYSVKKSFVERTFSLNGFSYFYLDGRYLGDAVRVTTTGNYSTPVHSVAFILSFRLLMLNPKLLKFCEDDGLLIKAKPRNSFQWIDYVSIVLDNWEDKEVKMLYHMMENFYYDEEFSDEEKEAFEESLVKPEYKNERTYYRFLASKTTGVNDNIIGNCAFVEADIDNYTIPESIVYVGDTAFSYCNRLKSLEFKGKVLFGSFPIVECDSLEQIIVPSEMVDYYRRSLPFYRNIIVDERIDVSKQGEKQDVKVEKMEPATKESDVPQIEQHQIDVKILEHIFDNKSTSYKYFWFMSIISLAKEKNNMAIAFKDILIRMAAMAWPIVFDYEIELGKNDMLPKYLESIVKNTKLINNASSNVVETYLQQHYNSQGIKDILAPLAKNVPYRFLSPWIPFTTNDEVVEKSNDNNLLCLYAIHGEDVILDEDWWEYINENYTKICNFSVQSFINYVKKNNNQMKLLKFMTEGWSLANK